MGYVSVLEAKTHLGITIAKHDTEISRAIDAASAAIDAYCGRTFTATASGTRTVQARNPWKVTIPDCTAVTTVKTDETDDGTFDTTWTVTDDYVTDPPDGITRDGMTGWPITRLVAVGTKTFPTVGKRPRRLEVVGSFGWTATPDDIEQACLTLATERFRSKDATFGIAGVNDFGPIRVRENSLVRGMLNPYRTPARAAMVA